VNIIIIMFYYAIMAARHTVQNTHIRSYTQIHPLKTQKKFKTVKTVKRNRTGNISGRYDSTRNGIFEGVHYKDRSRFLAVLMLMIWLDLR